MADSIGLTGARLKVSPVLGVHSGLKLSSSASISQKEKIEKCVCLVNPHTSLQHAHHTSHTSSCTCQLFSLLTLFSKSQLSEAYSL